MRLLTAAGTVVAERLEVASSALARHRGLLGRSGLAPGEGLLIERCWAIHTWFMRFAIDVAFIDPEGRVTRSCEALRPWRLAAASGARDVVELPAGTLARHGVRAGTVLRVEPS